MRPARRTASDTAGDNHSESFGVSPSFGHKFAGRHRRSSLDGQSLGCLSLLVAEEYAERPRAIPSLGISGELSASGMHALPTVHRHRPRAVLSSPDNDELQGQQMEKRIPPSGALKPGGVPSHDQTASLSTDAPMPLRTEVPKAVVSPADELLYIGEKETPISDEASSCSTSSNRENSIELMPPLNQMMENRLPRIFTTGVSNKKDTDIGLPPKIRYEKIGNVENLTGDVETKMSAKKHGGPPPTDALQRSSKQSVSPRLPKRSSVRVLRPWY